MNNITASESCKSEGPWGDQSSYHQIPFAPGGSIKNGFRRLVIYQQFTSGNSWVGYMLYFCDKYARLFSDGRSVTLTYHPIYIIAKKRQ